jgi:hypothetical protein
MATNTYVSIATTTFGSAAASYTFSSIPSTYTDLVLVGNFALASASNALNLQFNSDTATNYSVTTLYGDGSAAASTKSATRNTIPVSYYVCASTTLGESALIVSVQNYSNATTYKTTLGRMNRGSASNYPGAESTVGLWRSTAAITSITISSAVNISVGSTFTLYGIKAAGANPADTAKATGGTITYTDTDVIHTFTSSGTFTPSVPLTCEYLVVAGGGAGGASGGTGGGYPAGAGGGAGGFLAGSLSVSATGYSIQVGGGGAGQSGNNSTAGTGVNSIFSSVTATGGGGGGSYVLPTNGGSGGGGGYNSTSNGVKGLGTDGQGNHGGTWNTGDSGTGGGGAGSVGFQNAGNTGGNGGTGLYSVISGSATSYAGGGGGGAWSPGSAGTASNGGGAGGANGSNGTAATANTGGGGGGSGATNGVSGTRTAGNGGSGIVIVRYAK